MHSHIWPLQFTFKILLCQRPILWLFIPSEVLSATTTLEAVLASQRSISKVKVNSQMTVIGRQWPSNGQWLSHQCLCTLQGSSATLYYLPARAKWGDMFGRPTVASNLCLPQRINGNRSWLVDFLPTDCNRWSENEQDFFDGIRQHARDNFWKGQ